MRQRTGSPWALGASWAGIRIWGRAGGSGDRRKGQRGTGPGGPEAQSWGSGTKLNYFEGDIDVADHLAALGIGSESQEERQDQVRRILSSAEPHSKREDGMTLRWTDPSGAELWIYVDGTGAMRSVQPHFAGGARISLEIQDVLHREEVSPFDGGFIGLTQTGGTNPTLGGGFPVVFDAPDFPDVQEVPLTAKHDVELAAFAVEFNAYSTEEAFKEAQPEMKPLELPAFIPAGLVGITEGDTPSAHALMVGALLEVSEVTNELTGKSFHRILMETPAGPMDLLVEPDLMSEAREKGTILQVGAWISGRITPEDDEK